MSAPIPCHLFLAEQLQIDAALVVHMSAALDADHKYFLVSPTAQRAWRQQSAMVILQATWATLQVRRFLRPEDCTCELTVLMMVAETFLCLLGEDAGGIAFLRR